MKKIFIPLCFVAVLLSCKKEVVEGPQGPQGVAGTNGSATTGTISGTVRHYDTYSSLITSNLNTTTVSVDGTTLITVTDVNGNFTLTEIPNGIFDLSFTKPGTGLKKINQVVFPGTGKLVLNAELYNKPTYTFLSGSIKDTLFAFQPSYIVNLNLAPVSNARTALLIFGKTNAVDISNPATYECENNLYIAPNQSTINSSRSLDHPIYNAFESGSIMFVKLYPISNLEATYYDYNTGKNVHTDYGTPLAGTFTLTKP